ncbi:RNA polymerase sigma factor [Pseudohalocynthiibacter aestuariivivens]|uniref:RNA polymerase sigma factor n=1 Tax=Roseovarius pelagicus TaxID=2980108 RepID=A0ABY6DC95_9RHOB|nr:MULTISPECIES: RNA polymerase sigma factor [Rhodobacterales]QIE44317.1 RNA polymerase sigma factor [Pseudohalocynthiibacter aestuariivivens]UXX83766.1 RNA polymerase sigma factor [Roseovarius pelagicus]
MPNPVHMPDTLIDLHADLLRLARRLAQNEAEAHDLTQETLLRLWQRWAALEEIEDLRAYARAALRNLFRASKRRTPMQPETDAPEPCIDPNVFGVIALRELVAAITRLPEDQATLMRLVARGETSPQVLAHAIGCPTGTVMSRLARARAQLRTEMHLDANAPVKSLL